MQKPFHKAQQLIEYILIITAIVVLIYAFVSRASFQRAVNEQLKVPSKFIQQKQSQLPP